MTPEERALRVVEKMREPFANSPAVALLTLIASAIREAQASARDDALEEAAVRLEEGITETKASGGVATTRSPWAASVVRSLKSKG